MAKGNLSYFEQWKKGWKVIFMLFLVNLSGLILFIPIAILTTFILDFEALYFPLSILGFLSFGPILSYKIMKFIYKEAD
jgi:hypothetical protein